MKLTFKSKKSVSEIFEYLSDMQKYAAVHPIISKIETCNEHNYLVFETLKFGFLSLNFKYPVCVMAYFFKLKIVMNAVVMKFTKIEIVFELQAVNQFTIINETINFKSPLPVTVFLKRIFKKQHEQMFRNIEQANKVV